MQSIGILSRLSGFAARPRPFQLSDAKRSASSLLLSDEADPARPPKPFDISQSKTSPISTTPKILGFPEKTLDTAPRKCYNNVMRKKPYTIKEIHGVPCSRCGAPSVVQWQICSLNKLYGGVCRKCDIELNRLTLRFMKVKNRRAILTKYISYFP